MKPRIRKARQSDLDALVELWKQLMDFHSRFEPRYTRAPGSSRKFRSFLSGLITSRMALVLVGCAGRQVVGYLSAAIGTYPPVFVIKRYGAIHGLVVDADHRREGIGQALVSEAVQWFTRKGLQRIEMSVATANPVSGEFWNAMGFTTYKKTKYLDVSEHA